MIVWKSNCQVYHLANSLPFCILLLSNLSIRFCIVHLYLIYTVTHFNTSRNLGNIKINWSIVTEWFKSSVLPDLQNLTKFRFHPTPLSPIQAKWKRVDRKSLYPNCYEKVAANCVESKTKYPTVSLNTAALNLLLVGCNLPYNVFCVYFRR